MRTKAMHTDSEDEQTGCRGPWAKAESHSGDLGLWREPPRIETIAAGSVQWAVLSGGEPQLSILGCHLPSEDVVRSEWDRV